MNWIVPSVIMISAALLMEGLMTGLGSGMLACVGYLLCGARKAPTMDEE